MFSPLIDQLIGALCCLPGVGRKSAQRMAFSLLQRGRDDGRHLAQSLVHALDNVGHCEHCRTFSETTLCRLCNNPERDQQLLCVVETPADIIAFESTACFRGLYFVTHGVLSPIDGVGPAELGLDSLQQRLRQHPVKEIIIATNPTVEGEATAHYLSQLLAGSGINLSRIAQGIPVGGNIEYLDSNTLVSALSARTNIDTAQ